MKEKFNYVIISILKQEDEDKTVLTVLGTGEDTNIEWQDVMMQVSSQDSEKRIYGQLKTVEIMLLPRPMTEEEYDEWCGDTFEDAPKELTSRINRIREIYDIKRKSEN